MSKETRLIIIGPSSQSLQLHFVAEKTAMVSGSMEFTKEQVELFREWFDAVQDLNPDYLKKGDYALGKKLYERLGLRVPNSISTNVGS